MLQQKSATAKGIRSRGPATRPRRPRTRRSWRMIQFIDGVPFPAPPLNSDHTPKRPDGVNVFTIAHAARVLGKDPATVEEYHREVWEAFRRLEESDRYMVYLSRRHAIGVGPVPAVGGEIFSA